MRMDELRDCHIWVKQDMLRQFCLGVSVEELMDLGYYGRHELNVFIQ